MKILTRTANEKAIEQRKRTHSLALEGGLVRVAKRILKEKGIVPPDGPLLVGIIIEGMEKLASLPPEKAVAIRNVGFLAMNKKRLQASQKKVGGPEKRMSRPKQFYQDTAIDLNLNL